MLTPLSGRQNSFLLALVSGFADALFFIHIGGLFVGLVTGNAVLLGLGLAGHENGGLSGLQLMTFPAFIAGAGATAILAARFSSLERATCWTLAACAMAFSLSAALGILGPVPTAAYVLPTVIAMGMLTGIDRLDTSLGPPFSLMTGNIAGLAIAAARRLIGYAEKPGERGQSLTSVTLVCGFLAGCAAGALTEAMIGVGGMIIPAIVLFVIAAPHALRISQKPA